MKKGIHPENYRLVAFKDMSNEDVFITKSTASSNETIEVDGVEYPLIKMEIYNTLILWIFVSILIVKKLL